MMYRTTSSPNIGNTVSRTYSFIFSFVSFQEEAGGTEQGGTEQDGMAGTSSKTKKARKSNLKGDNRPHKFRQNTGVLPVTVSVSTANAVPPLF